MPLGVSIYLFFKILETVEGWSPNSSDISLLVNVSIFIGLFLKKFICFEKIYSPTLRTVSFLFFTEDSNHLASEIFSDISEFLFFFKSFLIFFVKSSSILIFGKSLFMNLIFELLFSTTIFKSGYIYFDSSKFKPGLRSHFLISFSADSKDSIVPPFSIKSI